MNRYPLWKYILIAAAMLFGLIYTLPNFFGESPAVQVSPLRGMTKVDQGLMKQVEEVLKQNNLAFQGIAFDSSGVKVRFADADTQIKAKDILQSNLGENFVVALNLLSSSPKWLSSMGALPMYLGLDLRGGVHFLLQVDMKGAITKALDRYNGDIRTSLREKRIAYAGISRQDQAVEIKFRDAESRQKAMDELQKTSPDLLLKEVDAGAEFKLVATLKLGAQKRIQEFALQQNITTLRNRINELGVAEPIIQQQGIDRVVVQLPGVQDTAKAKDILGRTATLEIRMVDEEHDVTAAVQSGQIPFGSELYTERKGLPLLVKKGVVLTGDYISDAQPGFEGQSGEPAVHINLDGRGARIFKQLTRDNVGKRMAILLIEKGKGEVITAPVIREEIGGGRVQISGRMTTMEASDVSLLLRAGALAAPMEIIEERTVGPSMGAENIAKGFNSNIYGFVAIAAFMMFYYRFFGVVSTTALAVNVLLLVAILSLLQATLTLPGMAGIALTVGMAIDSNVLINERIREEIRNGLSPQAAIHSGYERAFATILDSNITTLIAGVALFWLGSGPVRGFAVVLCLGILTSMFSAVVVSRGMVNLTYGRKARLEKVSI
ncbi:protein-export membrane protein, SecD/SecF family [Sulfuricella denitrificans skB26]|uniref:Protein translocase subunit SecD n=1 Tax=Sulfuricella denitrificans (strain DSM 22764 / NBRC 105220 / skB26) TaxID=1163617 RepID=S6B677_SULDS|nr:protein translocase subunit SecD [Sulfuricella denitrificans]BAN36017.1 protein-export membrane protein, SecD/SecF family [Sulfuricella denitrificans skB26]